MSGGGKGPGGGCDGRRKPDRCDDWERRPQCQDCPNRLEELMCPMAQILECWHLEPIGQKKTSELSM